MSNTYEKKLLIEDELAWYETKVSQIKAYIEKIDLSNMKDRTGLKESPRGGAYHVVVASIEVQSKSFIDMMEKLPKLFNQLDDLRNKYAEKLMRTRGDVDIKDSIMDDTDLIQ